MALPFCPYKEHFRVRSTLDLSHKLMTQGIIQVSYFLMSQKGAVRIKRDERNQSASGTHHR